MILFPNSSGPPGSSHGNTYTSKMLCSRIAPQPGTTAGVKGRAVIYALLLLAIPVCARSHHQSAKAVLPSDPGYVSALATANRFLHAWQSGDLENGMVLLSDGLRHTQNADKLEGFFSASAERAFEISTGRGHPGRYSFPIVLVVSKGAHITRRPSEITLVDAGKNDWVVDKLP